MRWKQSELTEAWRTEAGKSVLLPPDSAPDSYHLAPPFGLSAAAPLPPSTLFLKTRQPNQHSK